MIIETEEFYLREFRESDFSLLYNILQDEEVCQFSSTKNKEEVKRILQRYIDRYREFAIAKFAVFTKNDNEFVGGCGFDFLHDPLGDRNPLEMLDFKEIPADLELGYWFYQKFWGKGYATKLAKLVVNYAVAKFPELERIVAVTDPENFASQRVLDKIGFKFVDDVLSKEYGKEKFYVFHVK